MAGAKNTKENKVEIPFEVLVSQHMQGYGLVGFSQLD